MAGVGGVGDFPVCASENMRVRKIMRFGVVALLVVHTAAAEESAVDAMQLAPWQGRDVVVLPQAKSADSLRSALGPIHAQSVETRNRRIHTVSFGGRAYRAATPLQGPASRVAFDPERRKFVAVLSSIRVEADSPAQLDAIARATGAVGTTWIARLGVAFIELPESLHPVEAIERLKAVPGNPKGSIRLRRPPVKWL